MALFEGSVVRTLAHAIRAALPYLQVDTGKLPFTPPGGSPRNLRALTLAAPSGFGIELFLLDDYWFWREQRHAYLASQDRTPSQTFHMTASNDRVVALVAWMAAEFTAIVYGREEGSRSILAAEELATCLAYLGGQVRSTRDPELRDEIVRYLDSISGQSSY